MGNKTYCMFIYIPALEVNFNPDSYVVDEGESTQLTLELSSPANREVSVDVTLNPDTASGKISLVRIFLVRLHVVYFTLSALICVSSSSWF